MVELLALTLLKFLLLLSKLFREYLLLIVENLEVFFRAQELVVKILGLFLSFDYACLLSLDNFLELNFLGHHEVIVTLLTGKLGLKSRKGGSRGLTVPLSFDSLGQDLLKLGI